MLYVCVRGVIYHFVIVCVFNENICVIANKIENSKSEHGEKSFIYI